jgi:hypothetical protein
MTQTIINSREAIGIRHRLVYANFDLNRNVRCQFAAKAIPAASKQLDAIEVGDQQPMVVTNQE